MGSVPNASQEDRTEADWSDEYRYLHSKSGLLVFRLNLPDGGANSNIIAEIYFET